jgi:hypothetical protein
MGAARGRVDAVSGFGPGEHKGKVLSPYADEYSRHCAQECCLLHPGAHNRCVAALKQQSLLGIHDGCFSRRHAKHLVIKQVSIMNESAMTNAATDNLVVEMEEFQLPPISRYLGDYIRSSHGHVLTHREFGHASGKQSREAGSACTQFVSERWGNGSHGL